MSIPCLEDKIEIITAELNQLGFEGFWEEGSMINAFIAQDDFKEKSLYDMLGKYKMENHYSIKVLEDKNWNETWESNFDPVQIDNQVMIRASFHPPATSAEHEIIINPEMSFGTGHHETTELMIRLMLGIDFSRKTVLDLGSGTGVLAILASKMGAKTNVAIENDPGSVQNCRDNVIQNNCSNIEVIEGSIEQSPKLKYDIVLSNITKNINKSLLPSCVELLAPQGYLVISGFLDFDRDEMVQFCEGLGLVHEQTIELNKWQAALMRGR